MGQGMFAMGALARATANAVVKKVNRVTLSQAILAA